MKPGKAREIVIEFEKLQLVRKRAITEVKYCEHCEQEADFVSFATATNLFEIDAECLSPFVHSGIAGEARICLSALIRSLRSRSAEPQIKLLIEH